MNTFAPVRPGRTVIVVIYLLYGAEVARVLTSPRVQDAAPYAALFLFFILLYTAVLWRPTLPRAVLHIYLTAQCAATLLLLALNPQIDYAVSLFPFLAYQAALVFPAPARWLWCGILVALTAAGLILAFGPLQGLALALVTMAVDIILPALVAADEQTEQARAASQVIVAELQTTHERLKTYAEQVDEMATLAERNRLASELHDSVSQTLFSIMLNARSAQMIARQDTARLRSQLEQLQRLAQDALAQMRSLIAVLRPHRES